MDFEQGFKLIKKAFDKREEEKAWQMWLTLYPNMNKDNFVPFSDFYKEMKKPISKRPTEDILNEVYEIRKKLEGVNTLPIEK
jgi:hypothetical protein